MNFLGHIFLTPNDDELLLGNFIADSVKGNPDGRYSKGVADGIRLHRAIDAFTDRHPLVRKGVERFRSTQGRYSPVVIDVVYDHILASNWDTFHNEELGVFTQSVYQRLQALSAYFPTPVQQFFPYMKQQDWLYNYQFEWGFRKSLEGLDKRSSNPTEMHKAVEVYQLNKNEFFDEFSSFIAEATNGVKDYSLS
ncbi:MAG: hypothetical protein RL266_1750 [Bacteroidota bacterium]